MKQVKNNKAITKLTNGSMKANKIRNVVAVIAIALTTFMLMSVFSVGISSIQNYSSRQLREVGTTANAWLSNQTEDQLEAIKKKEYVTQTGEGMMAAITQGVMGNVAYYYADDDYFQMVQPVYQDYQGRYPEKEDEILLSTNALSILGIKAPQQGMAVQVPYRVDIQDKEGEAFQKTFTLTGWYSDYGIYSDDVGMGYVSEAFLKTTGNTAEETGILQMMFDDPVRGGQYVEELRAELNLGENQRIREYINLSFSQEKLMTGVGIGIVIFFVIFSGYLLIYNVFYLSVTKDIRFYGLLKTIGTSGRQLKKIVGRQALKLAAAGIPIGICFSAILLFAMSRTSVFASGTAGMFHPLVFIMTIAFSLITVMISVNKSSKKASAISPIEAVRFTGSTVEKKRKKKSLSGGKIYRMAFRNVFRDRKRAVVVMVSLFVGLTLFSGILTIVNGFDTENIVKARLDTDIAMYNSYENDEEKIILHDNFNEELIAQINEVEGITGYYEIYAAVYETEYDAEAYQSLLEYYQTITPEYTEQDFRNQTYGVLAGITTETLETYYPEFAAEIDLAAFERGELAFREAVYTDYYEFPEKLTLTSKENGQVQEVSLSAFDTRLEVDGYTGGELPMLIVSKNLIEQFTDQVYPAGLGINTAAGKALSVQSELESMIKGNDLLSLSSKEDVRSQNESMKSMISVIGGGLTFVLAFVGIVNFINIMMTSVQSRKKELSVLESIGMTKMQVKKMLVGEGLYYGLISLLLVWTAGFGISYLLFSLFKSAASYAVFEYPVRMMLAMSLLIVIICIAAPVISLGQFAKGSLTQRIREAE